MSRRLLDNKMDDIAKTGAATIATANPGCMMQLQTGVRLRGMRCDVVHVIELIDEALAGTVAKTSD
jgi:glycolate oxidase iron-sulfur subunit